MNKKSNNTRVGGVGVSPPSFVQHPTTNRSHPEPFSFRPNGDKNLSGRRMGKRGSKRKGGAKIVSVEFTYLYNNVVGGSSPASLLVNPSVVPTLTSIAATYQNFRFTKFNVYLYPVDTATTATNGTYYVGFSSDVSAGIASITATSQVSQCMPSASQFYSDVAGAPPGTQSQHCNIRLNRSHLIDNASLKWFKCTGDADTNSWENFQFQLIFYNATAGNVDYFLEFRGICEFSSPIPSQLTLDGQLALSTTSNLRSVQAPFVTAKLRTAAEIDDMIRTLPLRSPPRSFIPRFAPQPPPKESTRRTSREISRTVV